MSSNIEVVKRGVSLGAEIQNVDLAQDLSDEDFNVIHQALLDHQIIRFHGQKFTSAQQIAFGRRFGELTVHPFSPNASDTPELIVFDNKEGVKPFFTDVWHSDETFRAEPPMATMLHSLVVPEVGGDTMFASMTAAFEGLSDRMQNFVSDMVAVHDFKPFKLLFNQNEEGKDQLRHFEKLYPPILHPVVRVHPETKKKVLFVNPQFTISIKGMKDRESRVLLDLLFEQAHVPEYQFRHQWTPDTVVMWDNRSTQHYAVNDYYPQRRNLERVTIKGDRPYGLMPKEELEQSTGPGNDEGFTEMGGHKPLRQFQREVAE